jgi:class I fructose-bisphosphate aldolase
MKMSKQEVKLQNRLNELMPKGKAMFLAYDQGMEHGPIEFNESNVDPLKIIQIAKKGKYTGLILQKGISEKYKKEIKKSKIPLILKLNGKTSLFEGEPMSKQLCSVKEAIQLNATAVGYTIYIGSEYEPLMLEEFENIEREAHSKGIPVIAWIYPRGKAIKHKSQRELMAYSARVALEIGADVVKLKWDENIEDLKWAVKSAGRCKVVVAGGEKVCEKHFISDVKEIVKSGASGVAAGRNIWQASNPVDLTKKIRKIIFS